MVPRQVTHASKMLANMRHTNGMQCHTHQGRHYEKAETMTEYRAFISKDGDNLQVSVCWDYDDPNRFITAPRPLPGTVTEADLEHELGRDGYRLLSAEADNLGRGWALVATRDGRAWDPVTSTWCASLDDEQKRKILDTYGVTL